MNKNLLKELILPSFWLFFFMVYSGNDNTAKLKKENNAELKKQDNSSAGATKNAGKNNDAKFTKAVYLPAF